MAQIRLNKYIASTGFCSRREADTYIAAGKVRVNGHVITEMGYKVEENDPTLQVAVGRKTLLKKQSNTYVVLHKPRGYMVTRRDPHAEKTVYDLLPSSLYHVQPVGRLDKDSEGLLLLTNDGELHQQLTHPSYQKEKEYVVVCKHPVTDEQIAALRSGVDLEEGSTGEHHVVRTSEDSFSIILTQGWNRQVRRMVEAVGNRVKRLQRVRLGKLRLGNIPRGKWSIVQKNDII